MDYFPRSLPEIVRMAVYDEFVHKLVAKTSELRLGMVKQAGEGGNRCMIEHAQERKGRMLLCRRIFGLRSTIILATSRWYCNRIRCCSLPFGADVISLIKWSETLWLPH